MTRSVYISGGAHALLIAWVVLGGVFRSDPPEMEVAEVSVLSEAEFAALTAPSQPPESTVDVAAPPAPEPEPDVSPPEASVPDPDPTPPPPPDLPVPAPETLPEPAAPPAPPVADVTDTSPVLEPPAVPDISAPETAPRPVPRPAPRVAPEPVAPPEEDVAVAPEVQETTEPEDTAAEIAEPVEENTAPEAAATEIVTEAEQPARAPTASMRPRTRPDRPAPPAQTEPTETAAADAPENDTAEAVADAVAAALGGGTTNPQPDVPIGPPMTSGEREALRVAVQACWVVDVGSQAANVTVTVGMQMDRSGSVVPGSLRMLDAEGGSGSAVETAFQAARRAILRCQRDGYDLPEEKFAQWREIEMVFDPSEMRLR